MAEDFVWVEECAGNACVFATEERGAVRLVACRETGGDEAFEGAVRYGAVDDGVVGDGLH